MECGYLWPGHTVEGGWLGDGERNFTFHSIPFCITEDFTLCNIFTMDFKCNLWEQSWLRQQIVCRRRQCLCLPGVEEARWGKEHT